MATTLIYPMAAHVGWTLVLYVLLTIARAPTVWKVGLSGDGSNPWNAVEPRISANLSNQFEWPLFFHIVCLLIMQTGEVSSAQLWLSAVFVIGRIAHSGVQILSANVRLRGLVYTVNFVAVLAMWALLLAELH